MKNTFLGLALITLFLMTSLSGVSAYSIVPEFPIELNQEFTLHEGQTGVLENSKTRITVTGINVTEPCVAGPGEVCTLNIEVMPSVKLTVEKPSGDILQVKELSLNYGESVEVFDLKISNKGIFNGNQSVAQPDYATFIVYSTSDEDNPEIPIIIDVPEPEVLIVIIDPVPTDPEPEVPIIIIDPVPTDPGIIYPYPESFYANLNERFKLRELGTVQIIKEAGPQLPAFEILIKMSLNGFIKTDNGVYASLTASARSGPSGEFKLRQGEKTQLGNYVIYFLEYGGSSGVFMVKEADSRPGTIYVNLDREFELLLKQKAIVSETGLQVYLSSIEKQVYNCFRAPCPEGKKVVVLDVSNKYGYIIDYSARSSGGGSGSVGTTTRSINTIYTADKETIATTTIAPTEIIREPVLRTGTTVYIVEGESREVFGHKITVTSIGNNSATIIIQKVVIVKPPKTTAELNEKFKLKPSQGVTIIKSAGNTAQRIMEVTLNGFSYSSCNINYPDDGKEYICDNRIMAEVTASMPAIGEDAEAAMLRIREGEEAAFNNYFIRFADYYNGVGVFVVREGIYENIIKVKLDQKFDLKIKQAALVLGEDITIRVNDITIMEIYPPIKLVTISISKGATRGASIYTIMEGEELNLYGVKIQVLGIPDNARTATFVVTKETTIPSIINVHVNEKFKLQENQSAKVLEANMKINLMKIMNLTACTSTPEGSNEIGECFEQKSVQISVDSYVYGTSTAGVKVATETIDLEVITSYQTAESISESMDVEAEIEIVEMPKPMPPTPFEIYTLMEGQSVEVNDYEITVLYIGSSSAQFIVKEKSTGITYSYVISKGWNLFSMPGEIESERNNCNSSEWTLFEYVKETNSFEKITDPQPGKAYWLYNPGRSCEAKVTIRKALELNNLDKLTRGWNFVGVVPEMNRKIINKLGDCSLRAAYTYNAVSNNWENIMNKSINNSYLGKGLVLYTNNDCSLGSGIGTNLGIPSMPSLPPTEGSS